MQDGSPLRPNVDFCRVVRKKKADDSCRLNEFQRPRSNASSMLGFNDRMTLVASSDRDSAVWFREVP